MFTNHQSPNTNSDVKTLDWCRKRLSADFCKRCSHKSLVVFLELTTKIEFSPQSPLRNTASQIVDSFLAMTAAQGRNECENREKETHKHWQTEVETYRMQSEQERRKKRHFWHIWHAQSFLGESNNCAPLNEKMGMREMWEKWNLKSRKSFQKTPENHATDLQYENSVWWFRLIWFCWSD